MDSSLRRNGSEGGENGSVVSKPQNTPKPRLPRERVHTYPASTAKNLARIFHEGPPVKVYLAKPIVRLSEKA